MLKKEEIIREIKKKRELSGVENSLIISLLEEYLRKNKISLKTLTKSYKKIIVKDIRADLRGHVGRFGVSTKDKKKLLEKENFPKLLEAHSSTKERIDFYPKLKEIIKKLDPKSILDLGCGINPIALAKKGIKYSASDINLKDLEIVKLFFKKRGISGSVFVCDLRKIKSCSLPKADLCLILKVFDILGKDDYELAKNVLNKVDCRNLIVSFSTRTLSGKPMSQKRRFWFEKLLERSNYKFEIVNSSNEIFYLIGKSD